MIHFATRPPPGPARPFRFPSVSRVIAHGGTVVAAHLPGHPLLTAALLLDAGAGREERGREGTATVLAKSLEEGTTNLGPVAFALALERLGAQLTTYVDGDSFRRSVTVPVELASAAMELVVDGTRRPRLAPADVARVRDDEAAAQRVDLARPGPRAEAALRAALFALGDRQHRPVQGTPGTLAALKADDVARFHATWLTRAGTLLLAGDLDRVDIDALAAITFAGTTPASTAPAEAPELNVPARREIFLLNRPGAVQSVVRLGHVAPHRAHPDHVLMSLTATVLAGPFASRLNNLVRQTRGYTYGISGNFAATRSSGRFHLGAAVATDSTAPALLDILEELRGMRQDGVTEPELIAAQQWRAGQAIVAAQTTEELTATLADMVVHGLPDDHPARMRERLLGASVAQVSSAAARHLHPEALTIVVEGRADEVMGPLARSGIGEVLRAG